MNKSRVVSTAAMIFGGFMLLVFISSGAFKTINAGEKGVLFRKFSGGVDKERTFGQGFHVIAPWNTLESYNMRVQEIDLKGMEVLANNGLSITLDLSLRYRLMQDKLPLLHDEIGRDYEATIIIPDIRSATREIIGKYSPEELYSGKRDDIQAEINSRIEKALVDKYIALDAIRIRNIVLPPTIRQAIESKLKQEQESQEYDFRIDKEHKEAQRKKIEAEGIKEYQNIVSQSLSNQLLRWQGIEATKELAKAEGSKTVIIGSGADGLPLILGGGSN